MTKEQVRVLVVDDEGTVRTLLKRILEKAGYEVATAEDGEKALAEVAQQEPDAVLLDIKMPGLPGIDVLNKIVMDWPDICVVMVTGQGDTQTAVEAMKIGAYDFITKPVDANDLLRRLSIALAKREQSMQSKQFVFDLQQGLQEQSERLRDYFEELVRSFAREHTLLMDFAKKQPGHVKSAIAKLPPELQQPMSSVKEFKEALLLMLEREKE